ncbi:TetR/AcrR family transcriptional regulator [Nonomuraea endophytica]|uniref:AcrR family transcriptional regulator n=1 Tax=Nonomuraea endophytica TaxID=714136 RepID=A0A7W8EKX5_9ACTN|nr:TetR/AcrR family transcriptional regulator [Nonomuraea endophytica]MBB5083274.1 AcrR family transcriptional regulator [Nonomuraea endophytica]
MRRAPEEKQRDPERTRARILDAAVAEFGAKGFAGARVSEIAARAGVNKQLISYYFGGKEGLYKELTGRWQGEESAFADRAASLAELVAGYVRANSAHRDLGKLMVWEGLTEGVPADPAFVEDVRRNVAELGRRGGQGEFPGEVDPGMLLVACFAMAAAGVSFPQLVQAATGLDPASAEFGERYAEQVALIVDRLRP